jgi:hypothetical protein
MYRPELIISMDSHESVDMVVKEPVKPTKSINLYASLSAAFSSTTTTKIPATKDPTMLALKVP